MLVGHAAAMQAHVGATCLATLRESELVYVRAQIPDAVELGGRRMRDERRVGIVKSLPCGRRRIER